MASIVPALILVVQWIEGSESELVEALHSSELDVVVGGLTADSPWTDQASVTVPYLSTRVVVGVEPGESLPGDLTGVEVAVDDGDAAPGSSAAWARCLCGCRSWQGSARQWPWTTGSSTTSGSSTAA